MMSGGEVIFLGMTAGELVMAGGSVLSAVGQLNAGAAAARAERFNDAMFTANAVAARAAAKEDGRRQKRFGLQRQGANRALDPDKLDLLEDGNMEEELAFQSILHAGEVRAIESENKARFARFRGDQAGSTAISGAAATLLVGAAPAVGGFKLPGGGTVSPAIKFNPGNINRVSPFLLAT